MSKFKNFKINWRYAIGEFLIVVFGILAAFQLDACKEQKFNNDLYVEYLNDLNKGLKSDSIYYNVAVKYFDSVKEKIDTTRNSLTKTNNTLDSYTKIAVVDIKSWFTAYISNSVFEELNNSGRLNLIYNKDLRHNLISYYQYLDFVKTQETSILSSLDRIKERLLGDLDFQNDSLLEIPESKVFVIQNYLQQKQSYINGYLGHRATCHNINLQMLKQIKDELKIYE